MSTIREIYEYALSDDNISYTPFTKFRFGDLAILAKYAKFRVTVWGDFEPSEYRFRGFSGIVNDATFVVGGFGLSPFGRYPFGDGGVCEESSSTTEAGGGGIAFSGGLDAAVTMYESIDGGMAMSGGLDAAVTFHEYRSGGMSLGGSVATIVSDPSAPLISNPRSVAVSSSPVYFSVVGVVSSATPDPVSIQISKNITITRISICTTSAIATGDAFRVRVVRNNVIQTGITVTLAAGDRLHSGVGVVTIPAGDTFCFVADRTAGIGSATIRHVSFAYKIT